MSTGCWARDLKPQEEAEHRVGEGLAGVYVIPERMAMARSHGKCQLWGG